MDDMMNVKAARQFLNSLVNEYILSISATKKQRLEKQIRIAERKLTEREERMKKMPYIVRESGEVVAGCSNLDTLEKAYRIDALEIMWALAEHGLCSFHDDRGNPVTITERGEII